MDTYRYTLGQDCFGDWCSRVGHFVTTWQQLTTEWTGRVSSAFSDETATKVKDLASRGVLVTQYEPGCLLSDEKRGREYVAGFIPKSVFPDFSGFCEEDETLDYVFTDAESWYELCKKKDPDLRQSLVTVDVDATYFVYSLLWYPLGPISRLPEALADEIIANQVYVQVVNKAFGPSGRAMRHLTNFAERNDK